MAGCDSLLGAVPGVGEDPGLAEMLAEGFRRATGTAEESDTEQSDLEDPQWFLRPYTRRSDEAGEEDDIQGEDEEEDVEDEDEDEDEDDVEDDDGATPSSADGLAPRSLPGASLAWDDEEEDELAKTRVTVSIAAASRALKNTEGDAFAEDLLRSVPWRPASAALPRSG